MNSFNFQKLKSDFGLGALCLIAGITAGYSYFHPRENDFEKTDFLTTEVGKLESGSASVRYRLGKSLTWQDIGSHEKKSIHVGDAIFTATQSSASVKLASGSSISLQPNSLIVFKTLPEKSESKVRIEIQKGSVKIAPSVDHEQVESVLVEFKGKTYEVETNHSASPTLISAEAELTAQSEGGTKLEVIEIASVVENKPAEVAEVQSSPVIESEAAVVPAVEIHLDEKLDEKVEAPAVIVQERAPSSAKEEVRPLPSPVFEQPVVENHEPVFKPHSRFTLNLFTSNLNLSTVDQQNTTTGTVASRLSLGFEGRYVQDWNRSLRAYVGFKLEYLSFEQPTDQTKVVSEATKLLNGFSLGVQKDLSSDWTIGAQVALQRQVFVRSLSTLNVTIDSVSIPEVSGFASVDIFKADIFALGISGNVAYDAQASTEGYDVRSGYAFGGSLFLREDMDDRKNGRYRADIGFQVRSQNTTIIQQKETRFFLNVGINFGNGK